MAPLWSFLVLIAGAGYVHSGSDPISRIYVPDCADERYHLTDEEKVLTVTTLLSQAPFKDAQEDERRYNCTLENMAGEYLAEDDGWKRQCPHPFLCLYFWDMTERGLTFPQFLQKAFADFQPNFTAMGSTSEGGCNYRVDKYDQEVVCLLKLFD